MDAAPGQRICPECHAVLVQDEVEGLCPKCAGSAQLHLSTEVAGPTEETRAREIAAAMLPELEILELLGRGGMGLVFKARQRRLERFVALKLLSERLATNPSFKERFNREGRVLARLNHPNIVTVHDFGQAGDFCYLVMEYVDGVNLRHAMRSGSLTPQQALGIVPKICDAIDYAHQERVLHRDIKPENILLGKRGQVKIADFGIAKLIGEGTHQATLTETNTNLGTLHYMAPEQFDRAADVDSRADIYSLGVVIYEMLTGELPIGRFAPPSSKTPVDRRVDAVVLRALQQNRELRQRSAHELKTEIEEITAGGQTRDPKAASDPRATISKWAIAAAAAAVFLVACAIWFTLKERRQPQPPLTAMSATLKSADWADLINSDFGISQGRNIREVETNIWIRLTFTTVEMLEAAGQRWLTFDYAEQKNGPCERTVRGESNVSGFDAQTRMIASVSKENDAEQVRHNRVQFLLPSAIGRPAAEQVRDELARRKPRSVKLLAGQEVLLFRLRLSSGETMAGWLGAQSNTQVIAARQESISKLRERVGMIRERAAAGLATPTELAKAERDLSVAEAGNDEVALAQAHLVFARAILAEAQNQPEATTLRKAELEVARAEHAVAVAQTGGDEAGVARATVRFANSALQIARRYMETGIVSAADVLRAEADYVQAEANLKQMTGKTANLPERR